MSVNLSDLIKSERPLDPPRIIIYGSGGVGKTTFAASSNKPIFISTEKGQGLLKYDSFDVAKTYDEFNRNLTILATEDHEYKTLVIDTLDKLESLIWDKVASENGKNHISEFAYGKGYEHALKYFNELMVALDYLNVSKKMTIILLCHDVIKHFDAVDTEGFDYYTLDLHKNVTPALYDWSDAVFFVRDKVVTKKTAKGDFQGVGTGERVLLTEKRPTHLAKNRYSLPYELPFRKEDSFKVFNDALIEAINKGAK